MKPSQSALGRPLLKRFFVLDWFDPLIQRPRWGKQLTTVEMFVVCLVLVMTPILYNYYCRSPTGQEFFVLARSLIVVKLLITPKWPEKHLPVIVIKCYQLRLTHILVHNKYLCCSTTRSMACTAGIFCSNLIPWGWSSQMEIETFHPFVSWHCIPLQWQTM